MHRFDRANLLLGLGFVCFSLLVAFVWAPMDSATGLVEKVRRQLAIGDALAPTVAAGFLLIGGLMVTFFEASENARRINLGNLRFLATLLITLFISFTIMRWLGPVVTELFTQTDYRLLRATPPWKYMGFVVGGAGLVAGLIAMVEGRVTLRAVLIGLAATCGLILVYDVPFDDLLLPPNGDV